MGTVRDRNEGTAKPKRLELDYYLTKELAERFKVPLRYREAAGTRSGVVATRLLAQREKQVHDGTWVPWATEDISFAQCSERALNRGRADQIATIENMAQRLRDYVLPVLGSRKLMAIRKEDVRLIVRGLVDSGNLASRSVHHVYAAIAFVYRFAMDQEPPLCAETPCRLSTKKKGELPPKRDKDPRWRKSARWERWQIETLLGAPRDQVPLDRLAFYATYLLTGCRVNEAAGLQLRDYDRGARPLPRIDIVEQGDKRELKGGGPSREVPVHPVLWAILDEWIADGWPAYLGRAPKPTDLLIPSREGRPRSKRHMLRKLGEDLARLGLPRRTQHDARRGLMSLMKEDGADPALVAAITHEGVATETRGVDRGYTIWGWDALCDAMLKLRITPRGQPVEAAVVVADARTDSLSIGHHTGHYPPMLVSNFLESLRNTGGVDGTRSTGSGAETPENKTKAGNTAPAGSAENAIKPQRGNLPVTTLVTGRFDPDLATELRHASDALRSGRTLELTAEWRGRLAAACDSAADLLAPGTRRPWEYHR